MANKKEFGSKIGLIAATVGSAVGLGNVWRFPSEVQANGGAAFLLIYIGCVFILGISVMLAEFSLGRAGGSDAVGSFRNLGAKRPWWLVGGGGVLASYLILCFYMVVAGWTLEYLWQSITGDLYAINAADGAQTAGAYDAQFNSRMQEYIQSDWAPLINTYIMIGINLVVLLCGVRKGIERMSNVLMPLLFILLVVFCCEALSLPKAKEGLEFFFHPDFSKITPAVIVNALGQSFFSLSLGMGILITYSSYFPKDTKLTRTALTVSLLDLLVAILMGVIIFPTVMSYGLIDHQLTGGTLVFVTLPEVFVHMPGTQIWSILFFLLLMVAALTSTISIAEVSVAFVQDRFNKSRLTACLIVLLPLFVLSALCSLSNGSLADVTIMGYTIFDALDNFATNLLLPIVSIFTCIYIGWFAPKGLLKKQLTNDGELKSRILPIVLFIIRYIAPLLIFLILVSKII